MSDNLCKLPKNGNVTLGQSVIVLFKGDQMFRLANVYIHAAIVM